MVPACMSMQAVLVRKLVHVGPWQAIHREWELGSCKSYTVVDAGKLQRVANVTVSSYLGLISVV